MVGLHHRFNGHELGHTLGDGEKQGGLYCCCPWGSQKVRQALVTEEQQQIFYYEDVEVFYENIVLFCFLSVFLSFI